MRDENKNERKERRGGDYKRRYIVIHFTYRNNVYKIASIYRARNITFRYNKSSRGSNDTRVKGVQSSPLWSAVSRSRLSNDASLKI